MFLLGYDLGSSSVKAAMVDAGTGATVGQVQYPDTEMAILAPQSDQAEQHPADWWAAIAQVTRRLLATTGISPDQIAGIGIAYQMHGLVLLDAGGEVLRPAIIWCDSRAVDIGDQAFAALGEAYCLEHLAQSPGNFTASKLRWVRENEPAIFEKIHKFLLPGDYIAYRMTGEMCTTVTGLSEGICWDFPNHCPARRLLDFYEIPERMLADRVPVFAQQGKLTAAAAAQLGLVAGIPVAYRAGDQPNNALSLNVLRPGDVAATGGTSGVVYAVTDQPRPDPALRFNSFAHVNYSPEKPLTGALLCINGAGSQYRWLRQQFGAAPRQTTPSRLTGDAKDKTTGSSTRLTTKSRQTRTTLTYQELELLAAQAAIGADGLCVLPFGNGAERMLGNRNIGAQISGINVNRHAQDHLCRATLEGIAYAFVYGMEAMRSVGIPLRVLRVGNDNLFQSAVFSQTIATLIGAEIEMLATTGAVGAAKGAGVGVGLYQSVEEAMGGIAVQRIFSPDKDRGAYAGAYARWKSVLAAAMREEA